jgi:hypothetical protein
VGVDVNVPDGMDGSGCVDAGFAVGGAPSGAGNALGLKSASEKPELEPELGIAPSAVAYEQSEPNVPVSRAWAGCPTTQAGMAGTGKTTIAKTFCDRLARDDQISATFFASRQAVDRQDPSNVVRTFAYDLACAFPSSRPSILDFLRSTPAVTDTVLHKLVDKLLADPLVAAQSLLASNRSVVFVVAPVGVLRTDARALE